MSYLKPFTSLERSNLSGILQLRLARAGDILSFPRVIAGRLTGDITFQPGAGFVLWEVIHSSATFSASSLESMEGVGKAQRLPFTLPSANTEELLLDRMERDSFIAYYLDANLRPVVFGTPDRPLTFRYTANTGNILNGRNQYDCLLYSESQDNKAEYTGTITDYNPLVVIRYNDPSGEVLATLAEGETIDFDGEFDYREVVLPVMSPRTARFATVNYTKDGLPASAQIELGKTIILISDFTIEFDLL